MDPPTWYEVLLREREREAGREGGREGAHTHRLALQHDAL